MKKVKEKALITFMAFAMVLAFMPALPEYSVYAATQELYVKYINDSGSVVSNNYTYDSETEEVTAEEELEGLTVSFNNGFVVSMDNFTNGVCFQANGITNSTLTLNIKGDNVLTGTNQSRALLYSRGTSSLGTIIIEAEEGATLTINNAKTYTSTSPDNSAIAASLLRINGGDITVNQTAYLSNSTAEAYGVYCSGRIEINNDASFNVNSGRADGSSGTKCFGIYSKNGVYYASSGDFNVTAPINALFSSPLYIAGTGNAYLEGGAKASDNTAAVQYKNYSGSITKSASDYYIYGDKSKPAIKYIYKTQDDLEPPITSTDIEMTAPASGESPQTVINEEQYMGLISYSPNVASGMTFAELTAYTANISIVPKKGYSLDGLTVSDFTLASASNLSYDASTGVLSGTFPETEKTSLDPINTELPVYVPVYGGNLWNEKAFSIETDEYTATLDWYMDGTRVNPDAAQLLIGSNAELAANITITPKEGYTTLGVAKNGYTIAGCPGAQVVNEDDSSSLTVTFPRTASQVPLKLGSESFGLLKGTGVQHGKTLPDGITYDAENHIINVDGYTGSAIILTPSSRGSAPDIHFSGENKLSGYEFNGAVYGVYCKYDTLDITFDEGASLDIDLGSEGSPVAKSAVGICDEGSYGDINITGGDVDIDIYQDGEGIAAGICGANCSISGDADVRITVDADTNDYAAGYMTNEAVNSARTFCVDTEKLFRADITNENESGDVYIYDLRTTTSPNAWVTDVNHEAGTITYDAEAFRENSVEGDNNKRFELRALHSITYADSEKIAVSGQPAETVYAYEDTVNVDALKFAPSEDEYYLSGFALYALDDSLICEILDGQFHVRGCDGVVKGLFAKKTPLSELEIKPSLKETSYVYDTNAKTPEVRFPDMVEGTDYTVEYLDNTNAGTAKVKVTGTGTYMGAITLEFEIRKASSEDVVFTIAKDEFQYDGAQHSPEGTDIRLNGVDVSDQYDISAEPLTNVGTGEITATPRSDSNFEGEITKEFSVTRAPLTVVVEAEDITYGDRIPEFDYEIRGYVGEEDGSVLSGEPVFTVDIPEGNPAGSYNINGSGLSAQNYEISYFGKLTILPVDISKRKAALSYTSTSYSGKEKKPTVKISGLKSGTDFGVSYNNNKKVGTATVTITGKGNYTGTLTKNFKIIPAKPSISKLTPGKKKMTVKMTTKPSSKGATSYKIAYRVKGSSKWIYKTTKKQNLTISKLKKGKKYQVKVCSVNGKSVSSYTDVKTSGKIK